AQRSQIAKSRKRVSGVDRSSLDDLVERHAEHQELRQHIREIEDLVVAPGSGPVRRDGVRLELLAQRLFSDVPRDMADAAITNIEAYAFAPRREYVRKDDEVVFGGPQVDNASQRGSPACRGRMQEGAACHHARNYRLLATLLRCFCPAWPHSVS